MATDSQRDTLVLLVHRMGMARLILALAEIARENAREVEWQDKAKAKQWERAARQLEKCAALPAIGLN